MRYGIVALVCVLGPIAAANPEHGRDVLVVPSVRVKFEVPEINRYLRERARIPKLVFTKHPSDFPSMNPTLQVSTFSTGGRTADEMAKATVQQMEQLKGFKIVEAPHAISIRGHKAVMLRVTFPMTASGAHETVAVDSRMVIVVDGPEAAIFGLSGQAASMAAVE